MGKSPRRGQYQRSCCVCGKPPRRRGGRVCGACYKRASRAGMRICASTYHEGPRMIPRGAFPPVGQYHRTANVCHDCQRATMQALRDRAITPATDAGSTVEYAEMRRAQIALIAGRLL